MASGGDFPDDLNPYRAPEVEPGPWAEGPGAGTVGIDLARENPWRTVWTRPRATIRAIVDYDPRYQVHTLAMLSGIVQALGNANSRNLGDRLPLGGVLVSCLIGGPIGGLISLYLLGAVIRWSGGVLGGRARADEVRAAIAWASVPAISGLIPWALILLALGQDMFTAETPRLDANPSLAPALLAFLLAMMVLALWSLVLMTKTLGEVHGVSAWRALGAMVLGLVALVGIMLLLGLLVVVTLAMLGPR